MKIKVKVKVKDDENWRCAIRLKVFDSILVIFFLEF